MSVPVVPTSTQNLIELLLQEQGELSAVDRFSDWHETHSIAASTYRDLMPVTALKSGQQYAFEVDLDACSGCKACVVACHTLNGLEESETWRKVGALSSQSLSALPIVQHVTTACHHCVDPGCLNGCPVQAYEKDPLTGIVRHLDDQCFGCKYCTMMCPYEVPQYSSTLGIVRKCDMCSQRLGVGEAPACVQACPNQAIRIAIVDVAMFVANARLSSEKDSLVATSPFSKITVPTTKYVSKQPHEATKELASKESIVDTAQEGHLPLVSMIVLTQASVGMWIVIAAVPWMGMGRDNFFAEALATVVGIVGVHAALLHLGRPWLAYRAFLGWRTSWLSREAIGFGLFLGVAAGSVGCKLLLGMNVDTCSFRVADMIVAVVGIVAVMCTAMIYIATRRELWGGRRTSIDFGLSTIGLGLVGGYSSLDGLPDSALLMGVICTIGAGAAKLVDHRRGRSGNNRWDDFSARSGRILRTELANPWAILLLLHFISLVVAISMVLTYSKSQIAFSPFAIFVMCLATQAIHRWIYFSSVVYRRMPGARS